MVKKYSAGFYLVRKRIYQDELVIASENIDLDIALVGG
jgi:hypothetical protein